MLLNIETNSKEGGQNMIFSGELVSQILMVVGGIFLGIPFILFDQTDDLIYGHVGVGFVKAILVLLGIFLLFLGFATLIEQ